MAEAAQGSKEARGGKTRAKSGADPKAGRQTDVALDATAAFWRYARALADAWASEEVQARAADAYRQYVRAAREAWAPERLAERYVPMLDEYRRLLEAVVDPEKDSAEAYREYTRRTAELGASGETGDPATEAYRAYLISLGDALAPDDVERVMETAWQDYLNALRQLWDELDVKTVGPQTAYTLAQSAAAAASMTQAGRAAIRRRREAHAGITAAAQRS